MHRLWVVVLLAGCVPTSFAYTPSSSRTFAGKPDDCTFEVTTSEPTNAYEEIGTLKHYNGDVPKTLEAFKKAVTKQVCHLGGDAVITHGDGNGGYPTGTIIHYPELPKPTPGN